MLYRNPDERRGRPRSNKLDLYIHITAASKAYGKSINAIIQRMVVANIASNSAASWRDERVNPGTVHRRYYEAKKEIEGLVRLPEGISINGENPFLAAINKQIADRSQALKAVLPI